MVQLLTISCFKGNIGNYRSLVLIRWKMGTDLNGIKLVCVEWY